MNQYFLIASSYFRALEGRQLYPPFRSWYWCGWLLSAAVLLFAFGAVALRPHGLGNAETFLLMLAEAPFLVASLSIKQYRERAVLESLQVEGSDAPNTMDGCRRVLLERLCGVPADKFAALAKECSDLLALQRTHHLWPDSFRERYLPKIYDPESKSRLLTLVLSSLAIFVALFNRSWSDSSPSIIEVLADPGVRSLVATVVIAAALLFFALLGLQAVASMVAGEVATWWAKLTGRTSKGRLALRYLMRDLVLLHQSMPVGAQPTPTVPRAPQEYAPPISAPRQPPHARSRPVRGSRLNPSRIHRRPIVTPAAPR